MLILIKSDYVYIHLDLRGVVKRTDWECDSDV